MNDIKPVFGIGGPMTDSDFNPIKMTRRKAQAEADRQARKTVENRLSNYAKGHIFDAGSHYRIAITASGALICAGAYRLLGACNELFPTGTWY